MSAIYATPTRSISASQLPSPSVDPLKFTQILSSSRKAQVPYFTGWDLKPNSSLKLVAEIENEDTLRKQIVLDRAYNVLQAGLKRREYQEEEYNRNDASQLNNSITICEQEVKPVSILRKSWPSASSRGIKPKKLNVTFTLDQQPQNTENDGNDFDICENNDFYINPNAYDEDGEGNLSLSQVDSTNTFAPSDLSIMSLSPSALFNKLSLSEIKSDTADSPFFPMSDKNKGSTRSSTPIRTSSRNSLRTSSGTPNRNSGTYSIREEDDYYDDDEFAKMMARELQGTSPNLNDQSPVARDIQRKMEEYERMRFEKWDQEVKNKYPEEVENIAKKALTEIDGRTRLQAEPKSLKLKLDEHRLKIKHKLEQQRKLQQLEIEQEEKKIEEARKLELLEQEKRTQQMKLEKEKAEAAATAAEQRREKEVQQKKQKEQEEEALKVQEAAETKAAADKQAQEAKAKEQPAEVSQSLKLSTKSQFVPEDFQNAVFPSDLSAYLKSQQQLEEIKQSIQHISSTNLQTKGFYFSAMKVVNTPINSISNLSDEHLQQKIKHFFLLFEGKPVYIGDSMTTPFTTSSEQNGNIFVLNLFAFRFVKKSEAEITRGQSGITPLATLGVQLLRKFPSLGPIIRANFYKMCPFLVPLAYPRSEDMSNERYACALGHEKLGGTERTIQQVLLERLTAYCTLYGNMVNIVEKHQFSDIGPENLDFFSLKEVWRILATTMRLAPQMDVTCAVLQALLDTCFDFLFLKFKSQFKKLMNELATNYLQRIRAVTPPDMGGSLARLELFLESKVQKLR